MRNGWIVAISFVLPVLTWGHSAAAQNSPAAPGTARPSATTTAPAVAEQADQLLSQMGAYLGSARAAFTGSAVAGSAASTMVDPASGDGGFFDRSRDAGFGRGGWGSVHNAGAFSDRADRYQQSHPEFQHNAGQFQQGHPEYQHNANQFQQSHPEAARRIWIVAGLIIRPFRKATR
jgi:hypothetical protein